jgi:GTP-binding protein
MFRVAIVGRPNVGKSTLFNRLARTRKALVGDEPGITRDRILQVVKWGKRCFELIDTGGMIPKDKDLIPAKVLEQVAVAIQAADLVIMTADLRAGVTPLDLEVAILLKSTGCDSILAVNKVDVPQLESEIYQFYELGIETLIPVSAEHNLGIDDLMDELAARIPEGTEDGDVDEIRVAIVGRPNVGKSSLVNRILGEERVIVTEVPGTTRDSVDTPFACGECRYRLVDTAGIRRKGRTSLMAEKLSVVMARKNIEQSDVVILVIDAEEGATKLDATIGGYAFEAGRSVVIAVNKWDLIEKDSHTAHALEKEYRLKMRFLDFAPMVFVSAKTGQRAFGLLKEAQKAYAGRFVRVPTSRLNRLLGDILGPTLLSRDTSARSRLKFSCQVGVAPPTFVLFTRGAEKLHFSTLRFVRNRLRDEFGFFATPIRILQRPASKEKKKDRTST